MGHVYLGGLLLLELVLNIVSKYNNIACLLMSEPQTPLSVHSNTHTHAHTYFILILRLASV